MESGREKGKNYVVLSILMWVIGPFALGLIYYFGQSIVKFIIGLIVSIFS